ncbi:MAG: hypothetical protein NT094_04075 [Candidatus Staskawiczbacteria bacterium]|nr:hypothetical protein [Candidatus Staskawiczbacteria bacterium]
MQKQKIVSLLIILIVVAFIIPQITLAAWWNPFSWSWSGIFDSIFSKPQTSVVQPAQNTDQNQQQNTNQNNVSQNEPVCGDFSTFSDFVMNNIVKPEIKKKMEMNKYVITSFKWKRNASEPYITYPIIKGNLASYEEILDNGKGGWTQTKTDVMASIKKDSENIGKNINSKASSLGFTLDQLNTVLLQPDANQQISIFLRTFAFKKGNNIYSVVLRGETSHQAPGESTVTVTCGRALDNYEKIYDLLKLKADSSVQNAYNEDYVQISDVSSDNTVYALLGSVNHIKIASYYYFNGNTIKLVTSESYPADCTPLELQKVGKGMRCAIKNANGNYIDSQVTY